jgi:peptide chain release factor subunit 1
VIVAGNADIKNLLMTKHPDLLSANIRKKIVGVLDVSYGFETGLNEAIEQSKDILKDNKLVKERNLLKRFFDEISQDTDLYLIGIDQTMQYLESGAVESIICWENLEIKRYVYEGGDEPVYKSDPTKKVLEEQLLTEWLADHYQDHGIKLYYVSDTSSEGNQFCKGFGGIGGILRYKIDLEPDFEDDYSDISDDEFI